MKLRWKYRIEADVVGTIENAHAKRFHARMLDGQPSKKGKQMGQPREKGELYPLNVARIEGGSFGANVKVLVGPNVTQVYIDVKADPGLDQLEEVFKNLESAEVSLNEIVSFQSDEGKRFGQDTRTPTLSTHMLKTLQKLTGTSHDTMDKLEGLYLNEAMKAVRDYALGKTEYAKERIQSLLNHLIDFRLGLIQIVAEQDPAKAEKFKKEAEEEALRMKQLEDELALAKTPAELKQALKKAWASLEQQLQSGTEPYSQPMS